LTFASAFYSLQSPWKKFPSTRLRPP